MGGVPPTYLPSPPPPIKWGKTWALFPVHRFEKFWKIPQGSYKSRFPFFKKNSGKKFGVEKFGVTYLYLKKICQKIFLGLFSNAVLV